MRTPLIAGNWKMNKTINEAVALVSGIKKLAKEPEGLEIVVCPPFTALSAVFSAIGESSIMLGAQDMSWEKEGAFTGEISPIMLKDCGCDYVIIGHSERRQLFGETDENVNRKIKTALGVGLIPIVCVGETLAEREAAKTMEVIERQLAGGLAGLDDGNLAGLVIAYEPVWAIGTGKTATPAQAQEVHKFIRDWAAKKFSNNSADALRILYGGSVNQANTKDLISQQDIDGALVGGASLKAESFAEIIKQTLAETAADKKG